MKTHRKLILLLLVLCLMPSIGVVAYAAASGFTMTYLPGTTDTVTNMPAADSGVGGQPYTVSSTVPQREGFEFLGWTLDYGVANTYTLTYHVEGDPTYGIPGDTAAPNPVTGIREGSSVTLANALTTAWETSNGDPAPTETTYRVNYLEVGTDQVLFDPKFGYVTVGSTVTETAIDIPGWTLVGADTQDLTFRPSKVGLWTFTGWCSDEACTTPITEITNISADTTVYGKWVYSETENKNELTFYYEKQAVQRVSYTVRYLDIATDALLCEDVVRDDVEPGTIVTERAKEINGYIPLWDVQRFEVVGGEVILFYYFYDAPIYLMANAPMQATPSNAEPAPAAPSNPEYAKPTEAPVLTTEPTAEAPATASEPQETEPEPATKETPALASEAVSKNDEEENVNEND